jgi:hypothetical protein
MTMFLLDTWYKDLESIVTNNKNERIIADPKYIPRKGDRVFMGYAPAPLVDEVVFDYERGFITVKCYKELS